MTDRPLYYLLDEQGNPYPTDDSHAANELLKDIDARRVALTEKMLAHRHVMISTIFLCIDEQYALTVSEATEVALFQTCVFVNSITTGFEKYYKTRQEALQGHGDICRDVEYMCGKIEKGQIEWRDMGKELKREQQLREWVDLPNRIEERQ